MHEITPKTRKQILDSRRSKILKELMKKSRFSSGGIEVISEEKSEKNDQSSPKKGGRIRKIPGKYRECAIDENSFVSENQFSDVEKNRRLIICISRCDEIIADNLEKPSKSSISNELNPFEIYSQKEDFYNSKLPRKKVKPMRYRSQSWDYENGDEMGDNDLVTNPNVSTTKHSENYQPKKMWKRKKIPDLENNWDSNSLKNCQWGPKNHKKCEEILIFNPIFEPIDSDKELFNNAIEQNASNSEKQTNSTLFNCFPQKGMEKHHFISRRRKEKVVPRLNETQIISADDALVAFANVERYKNYQGVSNTENKHEKTETFQKNLSEYREQIPRQPRKIWKRQKLSNETISFDKKEHPRFVVIDEMLLDEQ